MNKRLFSVFVVGIVMFGWLQLTTLERSRGESANRSTSNIVIQASEKPPETVRQNSRGVVIGSTPIMPAQIRQSHPDNITVKPLVSDRRVPWDMAYDETSNHLYFTERPGRLNVAELTPNANVDTIVKRNSVLHYGEGGLMGLALHPDFNQGSNWLYLCETYGQHNDPNNRIIRLKLGQDPVKQSIKRIDPLIENMPAASYHDGCRLEFGPDGLLWATMGDAGQPELAQNLESFGGKILRMTANGNPAPDNPFDGDAARPYIYSYGHRNPQGLAWHPVSEELFASEHGPSGELGLSGHDEVNQIKKGANYGWPEVIGAPGIKQYEDPVLMFDDPHLPPAGMDFLPISGNSNTANLFMGSLRGTLLLRASIASSADSRATVDSIERWFETEFYQGRYGRIRSVLTLPDGRFLFATSNRDGRGDPHKHDDRIFIVDVH